MIPDDVILLIYTNWGRYWPDKKKYLGTDTDDVSMLHFPGKENEDCEGGRVWLVGHFVLRSSFPLPCFLLLSSSLIQNVVLHGMLYPFRPPPGIANNEKNHIIQRILAP